MTKSRDVRALSRFFDGVKRHERQAKTLSKIQRGELVSDTPEERARVLSVWNEFQALQSTDPFRAAQFRLNNAKDIVAGARLAELNPEPPEAA